MYKYKEKKFKNRIMFLGVPAKPSGFPLYLFPLSLQKDAAPIPNATR